MYLEHVIQQPNCSKDHPLLLILSRDSEGEWDYDAHFPTSYIPLKAALGCIGLWAIQDILQQGHGQLDANPPWTNCFHLCHPRDCA